MKFEGYKCDICGVDRGPTNHWLLGLVMNSALHLYPWDVELDGKDAMKHICGLTCASKMLSQTVQGWTDVSAPAIATEP